MEYKPKFGQPFTLQEASALDVGIISEEIARLQNSLKHLRETQIILSSHPKDSDAIDDEILLALEENKVVIGSQEERISILRMALAKRGILVGSHYDLPIQDIGKQEVNPGQGVYL
ncbi:hypothetical protein K443DRAFT_680003 [Laccaria amethystina LaAM-08-1]|uniref:Uncharacterized protein n=1 Tax=Laccaria amethystina LaAM-08-1 TaxID=1095629 RepID=A0A0C9XTY3_9AGAR|nr:hypothetical protein K443DRAFT_680003 [Laccaria amethystina LaAM-08-1]